MIERPPWLPPNFDTPEALVASYKEAQRMLTKCFQDSADAEKAIPSGYRRPTLQASIEAMAEANTAALAKVAILTAENKALTERKYDLEDINNQAAFLAVLATQGETT